MEALTVTLGTPLVTSTEVFIHIPTSPREYRAAFSRYEIGNGRDTEIPDKVTNGAVLNQDIRHAKGFPSNRLFSDEQISVIEDEQQSTLTTDKVTIFSMRPPELQFVNSISQYFRWFERRRAFPKTMKASEVEQEYNKRLQKDLGWCTWIDGLNMRITLRQGAIDDIVEYACGCANDSFGCPPGRLPNLTCLLLKQIQKLHHEFDLAIVRASRRGNDVSPRGQYERLCDLFLSNLKSLKLPTPWVTTIYPKNRSRFLIHILLYFGRFETEYRLMAKGNMRDAYIHAGLFDPARPQSSLDAMMKRYIRECLAYQLGSVFQHDRCLVLAQCAFSELLIGGVDDDRLMQTPCVLQTAMMDETTHEVNAARRKYLETFVNTIYHDLSASGFTDNLLPDKSSCATLLKAADFINRYKSGRPNKNLVVCGGPGNGKTTVCEEICLYAFSRGLTGISTSIVADRSKALGGIHIHLLCSIPARDGGNSSPGAIAEAAIAALYRKPKLYNFWNRLDFLCIDEFGSVSAEMLATIDIIARHVKCSSVFMGGMIVIATMDIYQLLPFHGTPLLLSMNVMTEFNFIELKHSVRAANDANLRRICELSRTTRWTNELRTEFKDLIVNNCNFVDSFEDETIPQDAIYVFSRKAPCKKIEELVVKRIQAMSDVRQVVSLTIDEESSKAGNGRPASDPAINELDKKVKPREELFLYKNGRYEFTYNDPSGAFQQGQLAILLELDEEDVRNKNRLEFYKGPAGCKQYPPIKECTCEYLEQLGWTKVFVPYETSKPKRIWANLLGRRMQYGVRLRVASTIHASMGSTYASLVTAVSKLDMHSDLNFSLWEPAQVVVLIS